MRSWVWFGRQSSAALPCGKKALEEWASCCRVKFADVIVDARYRSRAFAELAAFRYRRFWFALYRLPGIDAFTRLVVLPVKITKQDFEEKTLSGEC